MAADVLSLPPITFSLPELRNVGLPQLATWLWLWPSCRLLLLLRLFSLISLHPWSRSPLPPEAKIHFVILISSYTSLESQLKDSLFCKAFWSDPSLEPGTEGPWGECKVGWLSNSFRPSWIKNDDALLVTLLHWEIHSKLYSEDPKLFRIQYPFEIIFGWSESSLLHGGFL